MKCDICGKKIYMQEKRLDGLPVAVWFKMKDGTKKYICADCFISRIVEEYDDTDKGIRKDNTLPVLL